ncbi:MAG: DUF5060 domain-containing protein [Opitutaceae bacterium]|nr:DUF5060 domain-containing protein [Opitutaceae bacterium]
MPRLPSLALVLLLFVCPALALELKPVGKPAVGQRTEVVISDVPEAGNPFDPDQIRVDVEIRTPDGRSWTQPAFWHQDFTRSLVAGKEQLEAQGKPHWRARFWPKEAGPHKLTVRIQKANTNAGEAAAEIVVASGNPGPGYVRRSKQHLADLETEDGKLLRLIGPNICWPEGQGTYDFDRWFKLLRENGGNYARLWSCPWWLGFEHAPGRLNRYPLDEAWRLDHLFTEAEAMGLYLLISLDHHGMYQVNNQNWGGTNNWWTRNPYSKEAGGPCDGPNEFFTHPEARKLYQKRLRYLIARYGYSPQLVSWQFFNEIDNTFIQQVKHDDSLAWHAEMGRWLDANDPMRHLVSTSMTGGSDQPAFYSLPELDFTVYHSYQDPAPARKLAALAEDFVARYQKPMLVGEFGVDVPRLNLAIDPYLRGFRQILWGTAMGGSAGPGHSWWWEDMEKEGIYPLYGVFTQVMTRAGWLTGDWRPARIEQNLEAPASVDAAAADAAAFSMEIALNPGRRLVIRGSAAIPTAFAAERASEYLPRLIYGTRNPSLPSKVTVAFAAGPQAKVTVRVNSVASDNVFVARVGGREVLRETFVDQDKKTLVNGEISKDFSFPVPEGVQTIELENIGYDWTALDSLRIENARETRFAGGWKYALEACALRSEGRGVVYVVAPSAVYPAGALRYRLPKVERESVTLVDWPAGDFTVTWFDPETGAELANSQASSQEGKLRLAVPAFSVDAVAVLAPLLPTSSGVALSKPQ